MGDSIDLITTIKEIKNIQFQFYKTGEYRKANMIDFAIGYLEKYRKLLVGQRNPNENYENER